jgi:hypothetical protein
VSGDGTPESGGIAESMSRDGVDGRAQTAGWEEKVNSWRESESLAPLTAIDAD